MKNLGRLCHLSIPNRLVRHSSTKKHEKILIQQTINNKIQHFQATKQDTLKPVTIPDEDSKLLSINFGINLIRSITQHCLPKGFPHSVGSGYEKFMIGQMSSAVVSSAGGVLSMQALLYAMGLGSTSIPLAATLNWILKDGLGQLGGILFASFVNTKFDADPKRWRLISALALECSNFIEMLIPYCNGYFLPLAAFANFGKNVSALATSASRAAIHKSFAKEENLADITAKTASQNILSATIGTSLGISIATYAQQNYELTFAIFGVLSMSSLVCSHYSLQHVTINTLNLVRLEYLFISFWKETFQNDTKNNQCTDNAWIISPQQFQQQEQFLFQLPHPTFTVNDSKQNAVKDVQGCEYMIGTKLTEVLQNYTAADIERLMTLRFNDKYIVNVMTSDEQEVEKYAKVYVVFHEEATTRDLLLGISHGHVIRYILAQQGYLYSESNNSQRWSNRLDVIEQSLAITQQNNTVGNSVNIEKFVDGLLTSSEWNIGNGLLETQYARYSVLTQ